MVDATRLTRFRKFWVAAALLVVALAAAAPASAVSRRPDLRVDRLTVPAAPLPPTARFTVSERTRNRGRALAGRSSVGFYLSRDSHRGADVRLGRRSVKPLSKGRRSSARKVLKLPPGTAAGRYRVIACADDLKRVRQSSRRNDCRVSSAVLRVQFVPPGPGPAPNPVPQPQPRPGQPDATPVTIGTPAEGAAINAPDPSLSGHAAPGVLVTVSLAAGGSKVASLRALPAADGSWSVSAPGLAEGSYTATASQTDGFGRTQTSAGRSFRVDRTAPAVTLAHPSDGSTTADTSPTADGALGTASGDSSNIRLKLYSGASATGPPGLTLPVSGSGGAWTTDVDSDLGAGTYTLVAEQSDSAGNVGQSAPSTFQIDDTGPTVTLANPPNGARTNDTTPALTGTAGSAATGNGAVRVTVYNGPDTTGTVRPPVVSATLTGTSWTATTSALPEGVYTAQARQDDSVGNTGLSAPHAFTVDTTAPALTMSAPSASLRTKDATPTIAGVAGRATGDDPGITVKILAGATVLQTQNTTAAGDGSWSVDASALAQGTYTAQATQSDAAGNPQTVSRTFTVDTAAPVVTVAAPTPGPQPTFSGTASAATGDLATITVKIYSGASATGTPVDTLTATASGGSWSAAEPSTLSEGPYTVVAQQSDSAGNTGSSAARQFTVDTTGPAVDLAIPADNSFGNDTTPTFGGTAEDTTSVTVKIYNGAGTGGSLARTLTVSPSGGNWSVVPGTALPQGVYTAQAEQRDGANNLGQSTPHRFEIDTTVPTVAITLSPAQSGTYSTTPTVHVVADDSNFSGLACTVDSQPGTIAATPNSSHKAEGDVAVSGDGSHTVTCTAADLASNSKSASKSFAVDSSIPVVGLTNPAAGTTTDDPTPTFSGPAGTASGDAASVTVKVFNGTGTGGAVARTLTATVSGGSWSVAPTAFLPEGTYTARAEQSDDASNVGFSPVHTFTIGPATMLAAGDVGGCEDGNDAAGTAAILRAHPAGIVQTLGDNVYGNPTYADGSLADFQNCYGPNWGTEKARTKPAVGNHEYNNANAAGYFAYFGAVAGNPSEGWYSYELGAWHVVVLNSNCSQVGGCGVNSDQEKWLKADLLAHPNQCIASVWHHPLFTSDQFTGLATNTKPLYQDLYDAHAELNLVGHAHEYERFNPQSPTGAADANGLTEFVVGSGGESHSSFGTIRPNSLARDATTFGVLQLVLHQGSYSWSFLPVGGAGFADSGTASCH